MKSVQIRSYFWSVFFCIRTKFGDILRISPYSVRIQENTDQKQLRSWTLFTQCYALHFISFVPQVSCDARERLIFLMTATGLELTTIYSSKIKHSTTYPNWPNDWAVLRILFCMVHWLCVFVMSHTHLKWIHTIIAWMSKDFLLETGVIFEM